MLGEIFKAVIKDSPKVMNLVVQHGKTIIKSDIDKPFVRWLDRKLGNKK